MKRLIKELKPLAKIMLITIVTGVIGYLCAISISTFAVIALGDLLGETMIFSFNLSIKVIIVSAILRGLFRCLEQLSGHYIAFKILAILRDKVFSSLRKLAPAKLDIKEKGNLISIITSDIELLEVFYSHTISPILISTMFGYSIYTQNQITFSNMILAIVIIASSFGPVVALSNLSNNLLQTFASAERIFDILDEIPMVEEVPGDFAMYDTSIKSSNISFAYPNRGDNILENVFLSINKGDKIATVGELGGNLSSGEKQRIGLARAFLSDSPILILD